MDSLYATHITFVKKTQAVHFAMHSKCKLPLLHMSMDKPKKKALNSNYFNDKSIIMSLSIILVCSLDLCSVHKPISLMSVHIYK